jgi:hypothetical protein
MKTTSRLVNALGISGALLAFGSAAQAADCPAASKAVTAAGNSAADVVPAVAREIAAASECACDIVTAAIVAVGADNKDAVSEIVYVAVSTAPELAAQISECAAAAAPKAVDEIKAALRKAFEFQESAKNPVTTSGKSGKEIIVQTEVDEFDDFAKVPVDIRGIYLIPPVSPSGGAFLIDEENVDDLEDEIERLRREIQRLRDRRPGGGGAGGGGVRPS